MKKILITGGPVHAYLDDVKIITNNFKGGLISSMAETFLINGYEVTYICSKDSKKPICVTNDISKLKIIIHDGLDDYMEKVLNLSQKMDAVILGAAVANLIPKNKIVGKFPSHNYKEGDSIPIEFTIAPRIIDRVKEVAPNTQLFGFKLLSGVSNEELVDAAYGVLLESKATAIFANSAQDLNKKYIVCKDRSVHISRHEDLVKWIISRLEDEYYKTKHYMDFSIEKNKKFQDLIENNRNNFTNKSGIIFGCLAIRFGNGFLTTIRGKNELDGCTYVSLVNHSDMTVFSLGKNKATLNAPLLDNIFNKNKDVDHILHFHTQEKNLPVQEWAPPGTKKDSLREGCSFNIKNHGCILSYDKEGNLIL